MPLERGHHRIGAAEMIEDDDLAARAADAAHLAHDGDGSGTTLITYGA
jgi:hypothetical protein